MDNTDNLQKAVNVLKRGGVIAYPTESVFGIGCNPADVKALARILELKKRNPNKGLIIVAADYEQALPYIDVSRLTEISHELMSKYWPGPYTLVLPASPSLPELLTGGRTSIAIRVSACQAVKELCKAYGGAVVSTSCNISGENSLDSYDAVVSDFADKLDYIVCGKTEGRSQPSVIIDGLTAEVLRGKVTNG